MACEEMMTHFPPEKFHNKEKVVTYYPKSSPYRYATGCRNLDDSCNFVNMSEMEHVVNQAVSMGTDPYAAVALSLMEQGTQNVSGLYLDPVGVVQALGCEFMSAKSTEKNIMDSYSTYYKVQPTQVKNSSLAKRLEDNMKIRNVKTTPGKSFYCVDVYSGGGSLMAAADKSKCCLELPFKNGDESAVQNALVYDHIRSILSVPHAKKDPAFAIQRFNGFSNLMGGAEGVSTFRMGVNYFNEPAYGYQAMDYMTNTLLTNPLLKQMVEKAETKINKKSVSVLCLGRGKGHFMLDSETYFDKHKNSKRLGLIEDHWKQGKKFSQLTKREQRVMTQELEDSEVYKLSLLKGNENMEQRYQKYFKSVYSKRNTVGKASTKIPMRDYTEGEWYTVRNKQRSEVFR